MADIKIRNVRPMLHSDWKLLDDEVKTYLDVISLANNQLNNMMYTIITISINGKECFVYHTFLEDTYYGVLMDKKNIVTNFGKSVKSKYNDDYKILAELFLEWYNKDSYNISSRLFVSKK